MPKKISIKDLSSTFSEKKNKHKKKSLDDDDEMNNLNSIRDSFFWQCVGCLFGAALVERMETSVSKR